MRRSARLPPVFERLDDYHGSAAAGAWRAEVVWFIGAGGVGRRGDVQESSCQREAGLTGRACQQPVMADAVEAAWQDVEQEVADELGDA